MKDGNERTVSAIWIGREEACLQFKLNGVEEVLAWPIYDNVAEFAAAAVEERRKLIAAGWRDAPPHHGADDMSGGGPDV